MKKIVISFLNTLEGYKTALKTLHWASKNISEHELWDTVYSKISDVEDKTAEVAQGVFGRFSLNVLAPVKYTVKNSKATLKDLIKTTQEFHSRLDSKEWVGLKGEIEGFLADLDQYIYLMDIALKEDIKRNLKNQIIEKKSKTMLTEMELRSILRESINRVLNNLK